MPNLVLMRPTPVPGTTRHGVQMEGLYVIDSARGEVTFSYRELETDALATNHS